MRHTLKWSFFIGTAIAGAVLALLKIFQPVRYEHLVLFGYAFVGSSVAAGYVAHKNLEKRNKNSKNQNIAKEDSGKNNGGKYPETLGDGANNFSAVVKRVSVGSMEEKPENSKLEKQCIASVPCFVPASRLLDNENELGNGLPGAEGNELVSEPEGCGKESCGQFRAVEKFLDEVEREEVEKEVCGAKANSNENEPRLMPGCSGDRISGYCGSRTKIFTTGKNTICGKFAGMDSHVILEDAECGREKKSLIMVSKSEIERMEIE